MDFSRNANDCTMGKRIPDKKSAIVKIAKGRETSLKIILDIYYAVFIIRKIQHSKSSKEKIFNHLKKLDKDVNHDYFIINLENLIDKQYLEVQEHGEKESLFLIKPFELFLSYGIEKLV